MGRFHATVRSRSENAIRPGRCTALRLGHRERGSAPTREEAPGERIDQAAQPSIRVPAAGRMCRRIRPASCSPGWRALTASDPPRGTVYQRGQSRLRRSSAATEDRSRSLPECGRADNRLQRRRTAVRSADCRPARSRSTISRSTRRRARPAYLAVARRPCPISPRRGPQSSRPDPRHRLGRIAVTYHPLLCAIIARLGPAFDTPPLRMSQPA